jgi:ribosomal protein L29
MTDISKKSLESLHKEIADKREELRSGRFSSAGSRARNVKASRTARREIARLLTEVNARAIASKANTK